MWELAIHTYCTGFQIAHIFENIDEDRKDNIR
jgi:hypothetical protein